MAQVYKLGLSVPQVPIGTRGATTSPTSAIGVIESQLIGKQLPDMIAVGISVYYLWRLSRCYRVVGLGTDAEP
jgi:hypothetical protein